MIFDWNINEDIDEDIGYLCQKGLYILQANQFTVIMWHELKILQNENCLEWKVHIIFPIIFLIYF